MVEYDFSICFNNGSTSGSSFSPDKIYHPDDRIQGVVRLTLRETLIIKGIEIRFHGRAHVQWTKEHSGSGDTAGGNASESLNHDLEEVYFDCSHLLWGKGPGNVQFERLDEGEHFFPFAFTLPHDVPCSFESVNGHIGYRASATMWLPNNISQTTNASFLVLRESDLNFEPFILEGVQDRKTLPIRSSLCSQARVRCFMFTERTGYVPGEVVPVSIWTENQSRRKVKVKGISVKLKQVAIYGANPLNVCGSSHKVITVISRTHDERKTKIPRQSTHHWEDVFLYIPPLTPSRLEGCKFINIKYEVTVNMCVQHKPVSMAIPIIIGTIPHKHTRQGNAGTVEMQNDYLSRSAPSLQTPKKPGLWEYTPLTDQRRLRPRPTLPQFRVYKCKSKEALLAEWDASPMLRKKHTTPPQGIFEDQTPESIV